MTKQETVNWINEHPEEAQEHRQAMLDYLNGVHLSGSIGLTEAAGVGIRYNLPKKDILLTEAFMSPAEGEAEARKILDQVKIWWVRVKDEFMGHTLDRLIGLRGNQKLEIRAD